MAIPYWKVSTSRPNRVADPKTLDSLANYRARSASNSAPGEVSGGSPRSANRGYGIGQADGSNRTTATVLLPFSGSKKNLLQLTHSRCLSGIL